MIEFLAAGSPRAVSRAIEDHALAQGNLQALIVPWESDAHKLSMAVTAVRADGWAIEHTNLGTIELVDAAPDRTRVAISASDAAPAPGAPNATADPDRQRLAAIFDRFASELARTFAARS